MKRKASLYVLSIGIFLLGGIFFATFFAKECRALPLGEVLGKDFETVTKEVTALLGDFPELKAKTTLVTCFSDYDIIFYVEMQVVQLWITPVIWERWQKLRQSDSYIIEMTQWQMIPVWRDVVKKFLPSDSSYLYWNYSLKSGWRVSILSTLNNPDSHVIPVLVVFQRFRVR